MACQLLKNLEPYRPFFIETRCHRTRGMAAEPAGPVLRAHRLWGALYEPGGMGALGQGSAAGLHARPLTQIGGITPARKLMALCE